MYQYEYSKIKALLNRLIISNAFKITLEWRSKTEVAEK